MQSSSVIIYTDGACSGNPGPGGYGIVMEIPGTNYKKEFSVGYQHTTNNRMELMAIVAALQKLKKEKLAVTIVTDSKYVENAVNKKWVFGWEKKGFKDKKNPDLWIAFLKEYRKHHIRIQWIKGHNQHPQNERCDQLAVIASKLPKDKQRIDKGFSPDKNQLL
ncbi:MAG: ribonuclease HI [Flavobacteriaceae bacterium]|nr:ribonuclease HI [Flavobacteriaceae bacterium]